jgi:hypothetical protein
MYKAIIAIGIAAAACLAVGCGSSGDETAEVALTKAEFIKQAEAICSKAKDQARTAATELEKAKGRPLDLSAAFGQVIGPALEQEAKELQALTAPQGDEAKLDQMFANLSEAAAAITEGSSPSASASNAYIKETKAYGLEACQF